MVYQYSAEYNPKIQQKPIRHGLWKTLRQDFHWKCLISTLLIHACILYGIWCHLNYHGNAFSNLPKDILAYSNGVCAHGHNFIPITFACLLYIVYLAECWNNRRKLTVLPKRSSAEVKDLVQRMCSAIPIVWWKSVCYHYIRRTRQVTRYRNGDAITATQVYYERVNSHSSGNVFLYETCGYKDISRKVTGLEEYPVTRMRFTKGFVFACVQAANEFDEQRTRFFNENEVRDDYMEVREGLDLAEVPFVEQLLVYRSASTTNSPLNNNNDEMLQNSRFKLVEPWYMKSSTYWISSVLLLSWPLRMLIECQTAHLPFQVTKLFGTNYLSPSSVNYTGPLTRTSTMESRELELANRENYIIIPSYSEAILLDPLMTTNLPPPPISDSVDHHLTSSSIRNEFRARNEPLVTSNETLIYANYGSITGNSTSTQNIPFRSMARNNYRQINGFNEPHSRLTSSPYSKFQQILSDVRNGEYSPFKKAKRRDERRYSFDLRPQKSQSMSFFGGLNIHKNSGISQTRAVPIPRPSKLQVTNSGKRYSRKDQANSSVSRNSGINSKRKFPTRSITISEVSDAYQFLTAYPEINAGNETDIEAQMDERHLLIDPPYNRTTYQRTERNASIGINEPPPPYEIALRMCAPLYERLHRSANSITSLLNSLPNSNLRSNSKDMHQYGLDGPTSSQNETCSNNYDSNGRKEHQGDI